MSAMNAMPGFVPVSSDIPGARWIRSGRSTGANNCVEATRLGGDMLAVRDSKDPGGPALLFSAAAWGSFLGALREGEL